VLHIIPRPPLVVLAIFLLGTSIAAQEPQPPPKANGPRNVREFLGLGPTPDAAAATRGEPLFKDNCGTCHGDNARGAQGPNLLRSPLVLHDEKGEAISAVIKQGRSQAGMPAFPGLTDSQMFDIAEFIHLQVELAANRGTYRQTYGSLRNESTGDPKKGEALFLAHCSGCHSVTGDLAHLGSRYPQAAVMITRIAWPTSTEPKQVVVTLLNGKKIVGTLLRLDDFDVSLRDTSGTYQSWPLSEVNLNLQDRLEGHRALLPKYSDADLHDLTAYLMTLK
jgi:cytochrome c oxidase cbb3-type subunit 3